MKKSVAPRILAGSSLQMKRAAPLWLLAGSLLVVQVAQLLLLVLYEKVDFDTFTYYFSKVELMRFWTVAHHTLMSHVQIIPVGFSKFQMLFAAEDYAKNAGNYLVVVLVAAYLAVYARKLFIPFCFLVLTNVAFFTQYTGYKADASLAALSVLLVHIASRSYFRFQLAAAAAVVCLMLSIKWTSGPVILAAAAFYLWRMIRTKTASITVPDVVLSFAVVVILANWLELGSYFETFMKTGSFTPAKMLGVSLDSPNPIHLIENVIKFSAVCIVETFEPLWRNLVNHPVVGWLLQFLTFGGKNSVVMNPNQVYASLNIFDFLGLIASGIVLRSRNEFVRNCGIAALLYYAVGLSISDMSQMSRYYLPAEVLAYIPLAFLMRIAWLRFARKMHGRRRQIAGLWGATIIAALYLANSAYMLAFDKERNLVAMVDAPLVSIKAIEDGTVGSLSLRKPIYKDTPIEKTFRGWQGYQEVYIAMLNTTGRMGQLKIIFDSSVDDAYYAYPFLRYRQVVNTSLVDISGVPDSAINFTSRYVLCFGTRACALRPATYELVKSTGSLIALWHSKQ